MDKSMIQSVTLTVKNLNEMTAFYKDVLGFTISFQSADEIHLSANGKDTLLILETDSSILSYNRYGAGLYHIAYLLPSRTDLAHLLAYFIENKIPLQGASDHGVSEAIYLADPEGNGIEIYVDRPQNDWDWINGQIDMITAPLDVTSLLSEVTTEWGGLPSQTVIGHIHLQVIDIKATEEFYKETLALSTMLKLGEKALFMSRDQYHHHFGMNTWNTRDTTPIREKHYGLKRVTLLVDEKWEAELQYAIDSTSTILTDPSGIQIQLIKG